MTEKKELPSLQAGGRALFEKTMMGSGRYVASDFEAHSTGDYRNSEVNGAWIGWEMRNEAAMVRAAVPAMPGPVPVDPSTAGWLGALADAFHTLKKAGPDHALNKEHIMTMLTWMAQPASRMPTIAADDVQRMIDGVRIEAAHVAAYTSEESSCQRAAQKILAPVGKPPMLAADIENAVTDMPDGLRVLASRALGAAAPAPVVMDHEIEPEVDDALSAMRG